MYFVDSSISRNILWNFVEMKQLNENESLKIGKKNSQDFAVSLSRVLWKKSTRITLKQRDSESKKKTPLIEFDFDGQ